jgi:carboxypeptidase Taq
MTEPTPAQERLHQLWAEIRDLDSALATLEWDQETFLPEGGSAARGRVLATLTGIRHQRLTSPALADAVARVEAEAPPGSLAADQARVARRDLERATRVPEELARALALAKSQGVAAWRRAREASDVRLFERELAHLVELKRQEAAALADGGAPYDALLDEFDPGSTEAALVPLFAGLRRDLVPLLDRVRGSAVTVDEDPARGSFPVEPQRRFGAAAARAIGFRFDAGRLDLSTHPFCTGIARTDVRMTWRYQEDDFRPGLFGILHESGHGLYEQGLPPELDHTPLGRDAGSAVHESQSRLWENHVGRSRGFWRWALPRFRAAFPGTPADLDRLWPTLHVVRPSFIRVEADEVTYGLHIAIRFEIERALFAGRLGAVDLRDAWNQLYRELLGLEPARDAEGVLQDIHWSLGLFGYFPTYALGSMAAAQLFATAHRDLGDPEELFARGDFAPLLHWLRERVHAHGARWTRDELLARATGAPLSPDALLAHLREQVEAVYGGR